MFRNALISLTVLYNEFSDEYEQLINKTHDGYQTIEEEGEYDCEVRGNIEASYLVTIPKKIVLDGTAGSGTYEITVIADLGGLDYIAVVPLPINGKQFLLNELGGKADVPFAVDQEKIYFSGEATKYTLFRDYQGNKVSIDDRVVLLSTPVEKDIIGNGKMTTISASINADISAGTWSGRIVFDISECRKGLLN